MKFNKFYFIMSVVLFAVELFIAFCVHDSFIRPFGGDILVVIFIYSVVLSFFEFEKAMVAKSVLVFSFSIEFLQYFDYVKLMGFENNKIISVVLGRNFEWLDFVSYYTGYLLILAAEKMNKNLESSRSSLEN